MRESFFSPVLLQIEESAHRAELIHAADDRCQGRNKHGQICGWLAFTVARQRELALRPKLAIAGAKAEGEWVLCPTCTAEYDRKHPAKQRKAS